MLDLASAHAMIAVSDADRAKSFYGGTLGLTVLVDHGSAVRYKTADTWFMV
jgi:catechol 2,3-dioxygenase-like lactoylglutathione lyase family enzyme